jgi:hypothetical protein
MACQVKLPARYNGYWLKEKDDRREEAVKGDGFIFFNRVFRILCQGSNHFSASAHFPPYLQDHPLESSRPYPTEVHLILATH